MTLRYEGVRFSDGSCAIRRVAADPCDRATLTFESVRELEEDVGSADVSWVGATKCPSQFCAAVAGHSGQCDDLLRPLASSPRFFPPPRGSWQLHDTETGQELRPSVVLDVAEDVAIVELLPGEQPVPPPDVTHRVATIVGDPLRPAYVGGHPNVRRARYDRTEETDEP